MIVKNKFQQGLFSDLETRHAFNIFHSNGLSLLIKELAKKLKNGSLSNPFQKEIIVIPNKKIKPFLVLELTKQLGIVANIDFITINELQDKVFGPSNLDPAFQPNNFVWSILNILQSDFIRQPEMKKLQNYIQDSGLKTYQLALKIADIFDQYLIYRPDIIQAWEKKQLLYKTIDEEWQQKLWLEFIRLYGNNHRLNEKQELSTWLQNTSGKEIHTSITRLWLYNITILAPFHLGLLQNLSCYIDVNLFFLNPSQYFWGDLSNERQILYVQKRLKKKKIKIDALNMEKGNSLLSSLGQTGKKYLNALYSNEYVQDFDLYKKPNPKSLLTYIQFDIFHLIDRGITAPKIEIDDNSIQIISTHTKLRELEILHNHLINYLANDNTIQASDIIVLCPNINEYLPYIDAVFSQNEFKLPYSIFNQPKNTPNTTIKSFLEIINLKNTRYELKEILAILEQPDIRTKFEIEENDFLLISNWLQKAKIRWGLGNNKNPELDIFSWKRGLEQLLLGYTINNDKEFYEDLLPCPEIEGLNALIFGRFLEFIDCLFNTIHDLQKPKPLANWIIILRNIVEKFLPATNNNHLEISHLLNAIDKMAQAEIISKNKHSIPFEIINAHLDKYFNQNEYFTSNLSGGITFAPMLAMRAKSFKVVCVLGLNEAAFPQPDFTNSFDLLEIAPQPLDRSIREQEKYLFLETIVSAEEKLYLSYQGQNIKDNSQVPPSIVVNELVDYICQGYFLTSTKNLSHKKQAVELKKQLITSHPLHSFSIKYFNKTNTNLFSYSQENLGIALKLQKNKWKTETKKSLPKIKKIKPKAEELTIKISELISFFQNPLKHYFYHKIQTKFVLKEELDIPNELFTLEALDKYLLYMGLIEEGISEENETKLYNILKSNLMLPLGSNGKLEYKKAAQNIIKLKEKFFRHCPKSIPKLSQNINEEITIGPKKIKLIGTISPIYQNSLVKVYPTDKLKPKYLLDLWLNHLLLENTGSLAFTFDKDLSINKVEKSKVILKKLVKIYLLGTENLLPFIPSVSYEFVKSKQKLNDDEALHKAKSKWDSEYNFDRENVYFNYYVSKADIFGDSTECEFFKKLAKEVFGPVLENIST
ncbi:exodeoxyribonuclease V subunit gamma [Candidatus Margulisiibacteriota bacterium]